MIGYDYVRIMTMEDTCVCQKNYNPDKDLKIELKLHSV